MCDTHSHTLTYTHTGSVVKGDHILEIGVQAARQTVEQLDMQVFCL